MICSSSTHLLVSGFSPNRCGWWVTILNQILLSYVQVRATLLGGQAGRTTCRDRLLDLFVAVNRLRSPVGDGYIVDSVDDCNNVGSSSVRLLKPTDFKTGLEEETNLDEEENSIQGKTTAINVENGFLDAEKDEEKNVLETVEDDLVEEAVVKNRNPSEDSEEYMVSLQSALKPEGANSEPLSPRFVDAYNEDMEKLRQAVAKKKSQSEASEGEMMSLQNALGSKVRLDSSDQELNILGYLIDAKGESHPMADGYLIGRDPHCQLCLSAKTVSRKHAKIVGLEEGGACLQLESFNSKVFF